MAKLNQREIEINESIEAYRQEAIKNAVNAFNDGYLLGLKYGRMALEGDKNENQS